MLATSIYMIVFRVIHVMLAIAWGGALFLLVVFLQPTAKAIGPAAGPFMRELLGVRHLTDWLLRIAGATIVAGGFLYWHDMQAVRGSRRLPRQRVRALAHDRRARGDRRGRDRRGPDQADARAFARGRRPDRAGRGPAASGAGAGARRAPGQGAEPRHAQPGAGDARGVRDVDRSLLVGAASS